jgi:hypothetical protein
MHAAGFSGLLVVVEGFLVGFVHKSLMRGGRLKLKMLATPALALAKDDALLFIAVRQERRYGISLVREFGNEFHAVQASMLSDVRNLLP